ncbi:hypothetical protein RclHR1_07060005 [Rhizophagus clarus]|uniref:TLDc domain-containing protein n=1 Tax=Rhizophagus clarus TaxID=94130 RepID=A0A2Z6SBX2_9GLOM|nr:hypothetical protein RclHR1_07060005 [Rhizophagus clarus]
MVVLHYRSPYLQRILSTNKKKNDGTLLHIKLPNFHPKLFIKYIYGGKLFLKEFDTSDIIKLLDSASKLCFQSNRLGFLSLSDPNIKPSNKSEYSIAKESKNEIDSKIITYQHAELISKWVDKLNISDKLISLYKFKLLFRASRDRYSRDVFHVVCDNQPRTVAIVKVKDSNEILGGYNPLEWNCYENFVTTEDSFIFSFSNDRIDNHILSRVIKEHRATFNSCQYGPSFGVSDLEIWSLYGGNCCKKSSYENPIRDTEGQFVVEDFEVFQILRE